VNSVKRGLALVVVLASAFAGAAGDGLRVAVTETADAVRLRIVATAEVVPGSVEVQLAGRDVWVVARGTGGRAIRSEAIRLAEPAAEAGAAAEYEEDGSLTVTLPKARPHAGP
jgi:HSP20 family molecular chaperone IbpA